MASSSGVYFKFDEDIKLKSEEYRNHWLPIMVPQHCCSIFDLKSFVADNYMEDSSAEISFTSQVDKETGTLVFLDQQQVEILHLDKDKTPFVK